MDYNLPLVSNSAPDTASVSVFPIPLFLSNLQWMFSLLTSISADFERWLNQADLDQVTMFLDGAHGIFSLYSPAILTIVHNVAQVSAHFIQKGAKFENLHAIHRASVPSMIDSTFIWKTIVILYEVIIKEPQL
ncbi:hypothetical protein ACJX0J_037499 [Zea mays]